MTSESEFRGIVEGDFDKLRLLLKAKVASLDDIKKEEMNLIETVRRLIVEIKSMEKTLEDEIATFKRLKGGWEKAYMERRWAALANALKQEIDFFNQEYMKTKDLFGNAENLIRRFENLREILKKMNTKNVESRETDLKVLEDFKKQKEGGSGYNVKDYSL